MAFVFIAAALTVAGCKQGAKTPEEAFQRLSTAVQGRDGAALYGALDLDTRWSWMTVRRAQREAYDIVLSNYAEGPERDQHARRFEAGALAETEAALFAEQMTADRWVALARALPAQPPSLTIEGDRASAPGLTFHKGSDGRWGYAGLADEAEERKRRATADLEQMRTTAADLERAATRAGR